MNRAPQVNQERLSSEIETLAQISEVEPPVVTRVVFGPADVEAKRWVSGLCQKAGLVLRTDAIGNMFARWRGSEPDAPVVGTGSHIDAIPNAGKFDGVVGVLGGLEAIRALQEAGFRPRHSIELLVFATEEPTRFGIGCLGSRMLAGIVSPESAQKLIDQEGRSLDVLRRNTGMRGDLSDVKLPNGYYKAFLELHIEQGPILEREKLPLGIVTKIAAPASLYVTIEGVSGHAGSVPMPDRRDALCGAAELILAIENAAKTSGAADSVATVGMCDVFPGAINSIPGRVRISADIRDTDLARRDAVLQKISAAREDIVKRRNVFISIELLNVDAPATCAPELVETASACCYELGMKYLPMTSRAYHDSLFMSRIAPTAMLFIPCRNGYSHGPDEYTSPEDISRGVLVLAHTLAALSEQAS